MKPVTASASKKSKLSFAQTSAIDPKNEDAVFALRPKGADVARLTRETLSDAGVSPAGRVKLAAVFAAAGFIAEATKLDPSLEDVEPTPKAKASKTPKDDK